MTLVSFDQLNGHFVRLSKDYPKYVNKSLEKITKSFRRDVMNVIGRGGDLEAYDTGALWKSIKIKKESDLTYHVGSNLAYSKQVHEGTRKMFPRPFLSYVLAGKEDKYADELRKVAKDFIDY